MKHVKRLLIILIVAVCLFFFAKDLEFKKVMDNIKHVNVLYALLFVIGLWLQFFLRGWRWGILLKPHKEKIPLLSLYNYTVIGFLLNLIPGKVGEAARGVLLAQEIGISRSYGLASVLVERLIDFLMIIVIFWSSLFFITSEQSQQLGKLKEISYYMFPFVLLLFAFFYFINSPRMAGLLDWLIKKLANLLPQRFRERAVDSGHRFAKGLRLNLSFMDSLKLMAASLILWLFLIPWYWLMMQAFPANISAGQEGRVISEIGVVEMVPYFSAIVVSASIPTPGMAGSFHVVSQQTLENIYRVNKNQADAYTILLHFLILLVMVVPGVIAFIKKGITLDTIRSIRKKNQPGENAEPAIDNDDRVKTNDSH